MLFLLLAPMLNGKARMSKTIQSRLTRLLLLMMVSSVAGSVPPAHALDPIATLSPSDVPSGYWNEFGSSVAMSGDYVAVGARRDPWNSGLASGAVYVFRRIGPRWIEQAKLTPSDPVWEGQLGWSVAMDGDVIVAGAPTWEFNFCDIRRAGAVYVYRRDDQGTPDDLDDDTWAEEAKLNAPDPQHNIGLGIDVSISGDVIVAGADCGQGVEVFRWNGGSWVHEASLTRPDGGFGTSVDIDADRIVVGAHYNPVGPGSAYLFAHEGGDWREQARLTPTDHNTRDGFGFDVSISASRALCGAPRIERTYVFQSIAETWVEQGFFFLPESDLGVGRFGTTVEIADDTVLIDGEGDPAAFLFEWTDKGWQDVYKLAQPIENPALPLALGGDHAAVGQFLYAVKNQHSLLDYAELQNCFEDRTEHPEICDDYDRDLDGVVDLIDFGEFMATFTGP